MTDISADIYQAAVGSKPWRAVLATLTDFLGARCCRLVGVNNDSGAVLFSHGSADAGGQARAATTQVARGVDVHLSQLPSGSEGVWHFHDALPVQGSDPTAGSGIAHRGRRAGGGHAASARLLHREGEAVSITIHFDLGPRGFTRRHRTALSALIAHLMEAAVIYQKTRKLVSRSVAGVGVLNTLPRPALVASAGRFVWFKNESARLYFNAARTLFLGPDGLAAYDRKTDTQLAVCLEAMAADLVAGRVPKRQIMRLADRTGSRAAVLSLTALRSVDAEGKHGFYQCPLVLLVVHDLNHQARPDPQVWAAAFDFTPSQARVAQQIFLGHSVAAAAEALRIAPTTVKSHLKELYWKTGTSRQTQLIAALAALQHA